MQGQLFVILFLLLLHMFYNVCYIIAFQVSWRSSYTRSMWSVDIVQQKSIPAIGLYLIILNYRLEIDDFWYISLITSCAPLDFLQNTATGHLILAVQHHEADSVPQPLRPRFRSMLASPMSTDPWSVRLFLLLLDMVYNICYIFDLQVSCRSSYRCSQWSVGIVQEKLIPAIGL